MLSMETLTNIIKYLCHELSVWSRKVIEFFFSVLFAHIFHVQHDRLFSFLSSQSTSDFHLFFYELEIDF